MKIRRSVSPLRYPGGKSGIYDMIRERVVASGSESYAEPFAGGFGLGLLLLLNGDVKEVYINDINTDIIAFWKLMKTDCEWLLSQIERVGEFTSTGEWMFERAAQRIAWMDGKVSDKPAEIRKYGWAVFYLNRVNFGGLIWGGPTGGYQQNREWKIWYHFNPKKLYEVVKRVGEVMNRVHISALDYEDFIKTLPADTFVFLDPPYVDKGRRLYKHSFKEEDHARLAKVLGELENPWCLTYDDHKELYDLYSDMLKFKMERFDLNHRAGKFKVGKELLITPVRG